MRCGRETVPRRSDEDDGQTASPSKKEVHSDSFYRCGNLGSEKLSDLTQGYNLYLNSTHLAPSQGLAHYPTKLLIFLHLYFKLFQQER